MQLIFAPSTPNNLDNMGAHTEGPWKVRRFDNEADGRHNITVQSAMCEVAKMSQVDQFVAEGNAILIAAAPELLAALEAWHYAYSECTGTDEERRDAKIKAGDMTRKALAKATGK